VVPVIVVVGVVLAAAALTLSVLSLQPAKAIIVAASKNFVENLINFISKKLSRTCFSRSALSAQLPIHTSK
jgi:conjugal transfer/entry exclusion protein